MLGGLLVLGGMFLLASITWAWAVGAAIMHGVIAGAVIGGVVGGFIGLLWELAPTRRDQVGVGGFGGGIIGVLVFLLAVVGVIVGLFTQVA